MSTRNGSLQNARGILHYEIAGQGPWVLLCHALGTDKHLWSAAVTALKTSFTVVAFDLRGHGKSAPALDGSYSFDAMAGDVADLLNHLGSEQVSLVGISVGGEVAQVFAAKYRSRVARLVLCSTACVTGAQRAALWEKRIEEVKSQGMRSIAAASVLRWFSPAFRARQPEVVDDFRRRLEDMEPRVYAAIARTIQQMDLRPMIREIDAPTLVVYGDLDGNTGPEAADAIVAHVPRATLTVIQGTAHFPNLEAPERFNDVLYKWLTASQ